MAHNDTNKFVHTKHHFGRDSNMFKKASIPTNTSRGPAILTKTCLPLRDKFYSGRRGYLGGTTRSCIANVAALRLQDAHRVPWLIPDSRPDSVGWRFRELPVYVPPRVQARPSHSWIIPSFAWNCALRMPKIKLELITDPDMFLVENSIPPSSTVMLKPATNTSQITIEIHPVSSWFTSMQTISTVMLSRNGFS